MRALYFSCIGLAFLSGASLGVAQSGTALARRAPTLNGDIDGSLQLTMPENVTLNGAARVTGDLLLPGLPAVQLNGNPSFGGVREGDGAASPTTHRVTLNGGASLRHVVRRTDPLPLPAVAGPQPPNGTRTATLNQVGQSAGDFATLRNLTLNGNVGAISVPPGAYGNFTANGSSSYIIGVPGSAAPALYSFQALTLNGNSALQVVGPVRVTVGSGIATGSALGNAAQPEWLHLRISSGGLTVNGGGAVHARLEAPDGTVTLNGGSRLVGTVTADGLALNGNALLRLLASATANKPPVVTLTAPADGAAFDAPASFALIAAASDSDGTVQSVEFFANGVSLGVGAPVAASSGRWSLPFSASRAQSISFSAKATDNVGASATSTPVSVAIVPPVSFTLPFLAGFEAVEGYAVGALHGQRGWTASSSAVVTTSDSSSGVRAALLPGTSPVLSLSRPFDPHPVQPVVFVDLFTLPRAAATEEGSAQFATLDGVAVAFVQEGTIGRVSGFKGNGAGGGLWQRFAPSIALDADGYATDWLRVTTRLDFTAKRWDLYINGSLAAYDLGFRQAATANVGSFVLTGNTTAPTLLDDFLAAFDNPVFADADRDGMDDAWEVAHGLSSALNDRNGDVDSDGLANILEFLLGTDPGSTDSDRDGLPDKWERQFGLNPRVPDAAGDPDGDEWSNLTEFLRGGDPTRAPDPALAGTLDLRLAQPPR